MYRELIISSGVPAHKLRKAVKTGKLSLTAAELAGSGAKLHLHLKSHEKALKAKKAGRGVRLHITKHEIKKGSKKAQGGSIWSKVWSGIKSGFKFAKDSGLLSKAADAPALATAVGAPEAAIPVRSGLKSLTGIGFDDYDSDEEGGRISFADVKRHAGNALRYAKKRGLITDIVDEGEHFLHTKATKPEHHELISSVRKGIKHRFGVGTPFVESQPQAVGSASRLSGRSVPTKRKGKFAKGSPEAKAHMARLRSMRKGKHGGSFTM
ncbi:uncharacterized protein IUM83_12459 [Phytophthora cinnamomi]|uniref:uncharacterized protein n=1 Tax=Phytophthora cinnamomi TaxID=4785 RepID=UPI002A2AA82C|nr:hypothetical protein IUM83_12459 [Phytophthora cinnamomi]KAJ8558660.1 hypothetical protein ON010_g8790 [Phytophthora cinnamomi]